MVSSNTCWSRSHSLTWVASSRHHAHRSFRAAAGPALERAAPGPDRSHRPLPRKDAGLLSKPGKVAPPHADPQMNPWRSVVPLTRGQSDFDVLFNVVLACRCYCCCAWCTTSLEQDAKCEMFLATAYQDIHAPFLQLLWAPVRFAGCNLNAVIQVRVAGFTLRFARETESAVLCLGI